MLLCMPPWHGRGGPADDSFFLHLYKCTEMFINVLEHYKCCAVYVKTSCTYINVHECVHMDPAISKNGPQYKHVAIFGNVHLCMHNYIDIYYKLDTYING